MNAQPSLLDWTPPPQYPHVAGSKTGSTSAEAAEIIEHSGRAEILRKRALESIRSSIFGLTADETAEHMAESILAVRPRISELKKRGLIRDTGIRRRNASGVNAKVWEYAA